MQCLKNIRVWWYTRRIALIKWSFCIKVYKKIKREKEYEERI